MPARRDSARGKMTGAALRFGRGRAAVAGKGALTDAPAWPVSAQDGQSGIPAGTGASSLPGRATRTMPWVVQIGVRTAAWAGVAGVSGATT